MAALDDYGLYDGQSKAEEFWRDFFRHLTGTGVIDGVGSELAVSERGAGANMSVDVAAGEVFVRGQWGESTSVKNVPISAADPTNPRIDRVVIRNDFVANTMSIEVLEGTPAGSPSAPALTQSSSRWEISLAQVSVPSSDTSIADAQITDERTIIGHPLIDLSTAATDGQVLVYDDTTGLWVPTTADSGTSALVGARAIRASAQSIPTATFTAVSFVDADTYDTTGDMHDPSGAPTRVYVRETAYFDIDFSGVWAASAGGARLVKARKNGTTDIAASFGSPVAEVNGIDLHTTVPLTSGDYVEIYVYQASGGNLNIHNDGHTAGLRLEVTKRGA